MTLVEIINEIKRIADKQPNINYVGEGDIYSLNSLPNIDYSVFFITQNAHNQTENTITYNFNLYYVDRLTENQDNTLDIQSAGILMLGNIINTINELIDEVELVYDIQFQPFTHKFADDCAGVYATCSFEVSNNLGVCAF